MSMGMTILSLMYKEACSLGYVFMWGNTCLVNSSSGKKGEDPSEFPTFSDAYLCKFYKKYSAFNYFSF